MQRVQEDAVNPVWLVVSFAVAIFDNVACGLGFFLFALRLYCTHGRDSSMADLRRKMHMQLFVSFLMTACFSARAALYIDNVIRAKMDVDQLLDVEEAFRLILICVSEICPIVYQLYLQRARKKQELHHDTFIRSLYDESEDASAATLEQEADPLLVN